MSWRDHCRPIIARTLAECAGKTPAETKAALLSAYPYGERKRHPYKIWCDEVARQQGRKGKLGARKPRDAGVTETGDPRQVDLFGDASWPPTSGT